MRNEYGLSKQAIGADIPSRMLKVVYIYKDFDVYNGLIETFLILSKKRSILPFDFEVWVFRNKIEEYAGIFKANGGSLINLKCRWASNPLIILKIKKLLRKVHPDIVQTFILKPNLFGIIAARWARVPVVIATDLTLKDQAPSRLRRLRDRFLYRIYAGVANRADHVICISEYIRKELTGLGVKTGISVIPPPLDLDKISERISQKGGALRTPQGEVTIGIVARLSEEKRHADLLEALSLLSAKHPNVKVLIVGDGPLRNYLEALSRQLKIVDRVQFIGFQKDVYKYLSAMDIFVLPSRTEGLGIAIMEAMASSLPVVASRVGGIPELVEDHVTGILFDPGNVRQLSEALAQLIEDPEKRSLFGENGKKKVYRSFHPDEFIHDHYLLYRALFDQKEVSPCSGITSP